MSMDLEKDFDDEVYEDSFYGEEEELVDEEETDDTGDSVEEEGDPGEDEIDDIKVDLSFACDDCDYRWDDSIIKRRDEYEEGEDIEVPCPMCGSMNVTQI